MQTQFPMTNQATQASALQQNRVLRNTYLLLAFSMLPTIAGAVLGAAREAVRNCERHAEAAPSIRGEVSGQRVELTIRDRGRGFDPDAVDPARRGISGSIVGRMTDLPGGAATVRSAPGEGTEVVLSWRT